MCVFGLFSWLGGFAILCGYFVVVGYIVASFLSILLAAACNNFEHSKTIN